MIKIKVGKRVKKKGAIVVILDGQNRTLILKRHPSSSWAPSLWGYPGGKVEENESLHDAAARETKEETNLTVANLEEIGLDLDLPVESYYTRDYSGDLKIDWEHDDWVWVNRSEIEAYDLAPNVLEMYDWVLHHGE